MKFFWFDDPRDYRFAWASRREPYRLLARDESGVPEKAYMEWEADSDEVGDFVWWSLARDVVVKRSLAEELVANFKGFELGPIEMFQNLKFDTLKRKPRKPRILLPYTGPELVYLFVNSTVPIDLTRSTIEWVERDGIRCPQLLPVYERYEIVFENFRPVGKQHFPREAGKGVFIYSSELMDASIFRFMLADYPSMVCCTEPVKNFIESHEYTNVRFREIGEIIGPPNA
ncbi:hypothetical protein [Methylicorpusculum sp.]|uniref:hypothetical protein n=1 Tax=Methylicorpusculum sp. TaxID=2713644 RepID=UPI002ABCE0EE|nr:hypothetical protein [Methylicorpusculum sp.]MDZ4151389.1 hypothetical protein [Methylicorpusculum sp.]